MSAPGRDRVDYRRLARLHRPEDPQLLAREARRLADLGLTALDIGQALEVAPAEVRGWLRQVAA